MGMLQDHQIVRDTYEVECLLGEGAFAEVYRVKHRFLGRQAMKVFKMVGVTPGEVEQMLGEAMILSRIGHPNIVRVFDANVLESPQGRRGYFTMEYVSGGTLHNFWQSHDRRLVPVATAVDLVCQMCEGLAVAHNSKPAVIHRDIKPQNVLVGYEAGHLRAKLSDFGLARHVNPLTLLATVAGDLTFKPPEVFENPNSDSCAGDVWAVGVTFYLLLTDRLPYQPPARDEIGANSRFLRPPSAPSEVNIGADAALDRIVLRTLAVRPQDRYPSAVQLLTDLQQWVATRQSRKPAPENTATPHPPMSSASPSASGDDVAQAAVARALATAQCSNDLALAADLMEQAFDRFPALRPRYEYLVALWRRGMTM